MNRCSRFLLFGLVIASATPATAQQTRELRGRVVDEVTRLPIVGAMIRVPDYQRFTLTNQDGGFRLTGVPLTAQSLKITQLGYADQEVTLTAAETAIIIALAPKPIELEQLVVYSGRMTRDAQGRATTMRTFWQSYDRDQIVKSGIDEPIQFLIKTAHVMVRKCAGINMPVNAGMCVSAPNQRTPKDIAWANARPFSGPPVPAKLPDNGTGLIPMRSLSSTVITRTYLDDKLLPLGSIANYRMADIHRVETFGVRGERELRFYTLEYINRLATGIPRPSLRVRREDLYERTDWKGSFPLDTFPSVRRN